MNNRLFPEHIKINRYFLPEENYLVSNKIFNLFRDHIFINSKFLVHKFKYRDKNYKKSEKKIKNYIFIDKLFLIFKKKLRYINFIIYFLFKKYNKIN